MAWTNFYTFARNRTIRIVFHPFGLLLLVDRQDNDLVDF